MSCFTQQKPPSRIATVILSGLSVWVLVLIALSTVPLNAGSHTGVYSPTGLITASAQPDEPGVVFERQLLPVD